MINAIKGVSNNSSVSHTFTPSGSEQTYTVPKGYHSGGGTVKCKAITLDGNAWAYAVLDGATFYSNSLTKQTGAMSNRGNKSGDAVAINTNYPNCPVWKGESTQQSWGHTGEAMVATCPPGGYYPGSGSAYVGIPLSTFGNAGSGDVLSGKTFTSSNGFGGSGSMTNHGALNWKPNSGTTYSVTAGYYSGGTLDSTDAYNAGYTAGDSAGYTRGYGEGETAGKASASGLPASSLVDITSDPQKAFSVTKGEGKSATVNHVVPDNIHSVLVVAVAFGQHAWYGGAHSSIVVSSGAGGDTGTTATQLIKKAYGAENNNTSKATLAVWYISNAAKATISTTVKSHSGDSSCSVWHIY